MELRNSQWVLRSYYKTLMYGFWTHAYHLKAQGIIILYELTEFVVWNYELTTGYKLQQVSTCYLFGVCSVTERTPLGIMGAPLKLSIP